MIYYIGYMIYGAVLVSYFTISKVNEQITMALDMAPEIVMGCLIIGSLPLVLFGCMHATGKSALRFKATFSTMTAASASIVVSLGLIGTFVGLTDMIKQIAGAVGAGGDSVEDQISTIMVAIGSSLDSMAFAFLTSVMGVAGSVVVLAASVFFREFFDEEDSESATGDVSLDDERLESLTSESGKIKSFLNGLVGASIDRTELASIQINNTKQITELSALVSKLTLAYGHEIRKTEVLISKIEAQDKVFEAVVAASTGSQRFLSGIYVKTKDSAENINKIHSLLESSSADISQIRDDTTLSLDINKDLLQLTKKASDDRKSVILALAETC